MWKRKRKTLFPDTWNNLCRVWIMPEIKKLGLDKCCAESPQQLGGGLGAEPQRGKYS